MIAADDSPLISVVRIAAAFNV